MTSASTLSDVLFVVVVALVAAFLVRVLLATPKGPDSGGRPPATPRMVVLALTVWLVVPGLLAYAGMLDRWSPMPAPPFIQIALATAGTLTLAFSNIGARIADGVPLATLIAYQVFRVPVEWLLHRLYTEGMIPAEMTFVGRNFDILTGLTAVPVALYVASRGTSRALVLAWNVLGLALLVNIVVVAVLATPTFDAFDIGVQNRLPALFPYVWLPTLLVQAALFGHLVVFRALRRPVGS